MSQSLSLTAPETLDRNRLDVVLAQLVPEKSRARLQALIRDGAVSVAGKTITEPKHTVQPGMTIELSLPEPKPSGLIATEIPLDIVYEDDDLIVINKPTGMVVHPAPGHEADTLVNALLAYCGKDFSGIGDEKRPGIVHRLDKDTSGLMVVAKSEQAHTDLSDQFADHGKTRDLSRAYLALVWGVPSPRKGSVDAPLGRSRHNALKQAVRKDGRHAVTHYATLKTLDGGEEAKAASTASLIECTLETGRTHQIRVHMAHIGYPVLNDPLYAAGFQTKLKRLREPVLNALNELDGQALHAFRLGFEHPITGEVMSFEAAPPAHLQSLIDALEGPGL